MTEVELWLNFASLTPYFLLRHCLECVPSFTLYTWSDSSDSDVSKWSPESSKSSEVIVVGALLCSRRQSYPSEPRYHYVRLNGLTLVCVKVAITSETFAEGGGPRDFNDRCPLPREAAGESTCMGVEDMVARFDKFGGSRCFAC